MLIRSAFWIGQPKPGLENRFRRRVEGELIPSLRKCPGVRGARALWPERREDDPPEIACQVLVEFDGPDELRLMMESTERLALRPRVLETASLFDGRLCHIEYRVDAVAS